MMKSVWIISTNLTGLTFFLLLAHSTYGLKCWVCSSETNSKCSQPFDKSSIQMSDCNQRPSSGNVIVCDRVIESKNGKIYTNRSCSQTPGLENTNNQFETACENQSSSNGNSIDHCWCRGLDGCNAFQDDKIPHGPAVYHGENHSNNNSGLKLSLMLPIVFIVFTAWLLV